MKYKRIDFWFIALIVLSVALVVLLNTVSDLKDNEILELKEQIEEINSECIKLEDDCNFLFIDAERMWKTDAFICCVTEDNKYYHKPFNCFWESEELIDVFLLEQAEEQGYTACTECYKDN